MPFYQVRGEIPRKRHTVFRKQNSSLYYEEHMSREGFSGVYSNLYHLEMPTAVQKLGPFEPLALVAVTPLSHQVRHLKTAELPSQGDLFSGRVPLFFNSDLIIQKAHPSRFAGDEPNTFYRNGHFDELWFVQQGAGQVETQFGNIAFSTGDYLVIPRGVIYRVSLPKSKKELLRFLLVESAAQISTPRRYRNAFGQLLEHSPFCERDIRAPEWRVPQSRKPGEYRIRTRLNAGVQDLIYENHPFDVVGWDGHHYPWAFSIADFEPIVGRIHQPPPVHQNFEGDGFVICSFVSRPFDFHPEAIPAPYPHSNLDSDEVLFYSAGQFMSRKGIFQESITYHPMGLAHGPQPGRYEESIGKKSTEERAVMIDTFKPLETAAAAKSIEDSNYALSWIAR